jgi:hypothetical protein
MTVSLLILFVFLKTYIVFKFTNREFFFYVFWRAVTAWWCFTTSFALFLSYGDPYFLDFNNAVYIIFVRGIELIYFALLVICFYMIKPVIKIDKLSSSLKIFTYVSILFNLGLIINIYFGVQIDISRQVFPFTLIIESMAKITPFMGIYYWKHFISRDKGFILLNIFLFYMATIPGGSRYQLLATLFFMVFFLIRVSNVKKLTIMMIVVLTYLPLESIHRSLKAVGAEQGNFDRVERMTVAINNTPISNIFDTVEVFRKRVLHSYYLIAPVYEYLEKTEPVGFEPVYSAAQSIIPASYFIDNSKPWPGSVDGTRFSSFSYLVNSVAFDEGYNMSEFPRVLHYLWEWNYIYLMLMLPISAFYLSFLFYLSNLLNDKIYMIPILSIFPFTYNRFFPTLVEILQAIPYLILPLIFIFLLRVIFKNFSKMCLTKIN